MPGPPLCVRDDLLVCRVPGVGVFAARLSSPKSAPSFWHKPIVLGARLRLDPSHPPISLSPRRGETSKARGEAQRRPGIGQGPGFRTSPKRIEPREGRQNRIARSALCRPWRGSRSILFRIPRARALGYALPPLAGLIKRDCRRLDLPTRLGLDPPMNPWPRSQAEHGDPEKSFTKAIGLQYVSHDADAKKNTLSHSDGRGPG
jgi:hypothetical protein